MFWCLNYLNSTLLNVKGVDKICIKLSYVYMWDLRMRMCACAWINQTFLSSQARIQRGDLGIYLPSIFWKLMEKTRLALKFSQEIRTETRISNINLNKTEKTRLALKLSQEIRTETRIWRGVWSAAFMFGGYLRGICSALYIWRGGGYVPHYTP